MPTGVYQRTDKNKHSEETKNRLRILNSGSNNPMFGKKISNEHKDKLSKIMSGNKHRLGKKAWNKDTNLSGMTGKKHSSLTKHKMSIFQKGKTENKKRGEEHHNWKGGVSSDPIYVSKMKNQRNQDKKECIGSHTKEEWFALKQKYNFTCLCCLKKEPEITLTKDHVIPVSKKGPDFIHNIQPLCISCNIKKKSKVIDYR